MTGIRPSFIQFISDRQQRRSAVALLVLFLVVYALLIGCYPHTIHCLPDASGYIHAANEHWKINYRPYGYSAFLNLVHGMHASMWFLTFAQYGLHILSVSVFLFAVQYLFTLGRTFFYILAALAVLAPVPLYFCNYAIGDSLFTSLTVIWITSGMGLLHKRTVWLAVIHVVVMLLALQVKYAALVYPFISAVVLAVAFAGRGWYLVRAVGIATVPLMVLLLYYTSTTRAVQRETGVRTFSGFSGWSMANNSTMILPYVKPDAREMRDPEIRTAHYFITQFPDSSYRYSPTQNSTDFIWSQQRAGKALLRYVREHSQRDYFSAWVYAGQVWGKYGSHLVRHYPRAFVRYFVWPNLKEVLYPTRIYLPPCEREVSDLIRARYNTTLQTFSYRWDIVRWMEVPIRIAILLSWVLLAVAMVVFVALPHRLAFTRPQRLMLLLGIMIILVYTGFILVGHPFEQRYMINVYVLKVAIPVLIFSRLCNSVPSKNSRV